MKKMNERKRFSYESPKAEFFSVSEKDVMTASDGIVEDEDDSENWTRFY
jgi:hypothetical protein